MMQIRQDFKRLGIDYKLKILDYLNRTIPTYPTPVEFHISEVTHVTNNDGFPKIMNSKAFEARGNGDDKFSWWSLKIDEESIRAAEERYLEVVFPNRSEEEKQSQGPEFLNKFTTSPAFHIDKSRYGNFRFTFLLNDLMTLYRDQMCGGQDLVLREYKTMFYKQEIMYVVLVHSPDDNGRFENFPMIEESPFVDYEENQIVWKAQAVGDAIKLKLVLNTEKNIAEVEPVSDHYYDRYYVWDHVSLAFHFNGVLEIPEETLQNSITCCKLAEIILSNGKTCSSLEEAEEIKNAFTSQSKSE